MIAPCTSRNQKGWHFSHSGLSEVGCEKPRAELQGYESLCRQTSLNRPGNPRANHEDRCFLNTEDHGMSVIVVAETGSHAQSCTFSSMMLRDEPDNNLSLESYDDKGIFL